MFNAILVIVSHVIDPTFRDDRIALRHLDIAMHLISRMSRSHSSAQRAYLFLQQMLKLMNSSLSLETNRGISPTVLPSISPNISHELKQQALQSHQMPYRDESEADYNVDFSTLLDVTHDLTENLGSHLDSYSTTDVAMWSWMDENTSSDAQAGAWSSF